MDSLNMILSWDPCTAHVFPEYLSSSGNGLFLQTFVFLPILIIVTRLKKIVKSKINNHEVIYIYR